MARLVFGFVVSLFTISLVFCQENASGFDKKSSKVEETESGMINEEEGNGVFILNKKGDTVKIRYSLYEELNIFCHTGWFFISIHFYYFCEYLLRSLFWIPCFSLKNFRKTVLKTKITLMISSKQCSYLCFKYFEYTACSVINI